MAFGHGWESLEAEGRGPSYRSLWSHNIKYITSKYKINTLMVN